MLWTDEASGLLQALQWGAQFGDLFGCARRGLGFHSGEGRLLSRLAFRVGLSRLLRRPIFNSIFAIVIARAGARPRTSRLVYGPLSRRGPVPAHRPQIVRSRPCA